MKKNYKIKLSALIPFILLSISLMCFANLEDLAVYNIAFISTGIGILQLFQSVFPSCNISSHPTKHFYNMFQTVI